MEYISVTLGRQRMEGWTVHWCIFKRHSTLYRERRHYNIN